MSSDAVIRKLQREADMGDQNAIERLAHAQARAGQLRTIMSYARIGIGDWAYVEAGSNYHEIGKLVEVGLDEIGRGIVVLEHVRRKSDESTSSGPTFLFNTDHGVAAIPTTDITFAQRADARYGENFTPWA